MKDKAISEKKETEQNEKVAPELQSNNFVDFLKFWETHSKANTIDFSHAERIVDFYFEMMEADKNLKSVEQIEKVIELFQRKIQFKSNQTEKEKEFNFLIGFYCRRRLEYYKELNENKLANELGFNFNDILFSSIKEKSKGWPDYVKIANEKFNKPKPRTFDVPWKNFIPETDDEIINEKLDILLKENEKLKTYIYNDVIQNQLDVKFQYIPVEIYIDSDSLETALKIYEVVNIFLNEVGFQKEIELQAIKGSWFKKLVAKSKKTMTSDEVMDRLKEAEYGLEVNLVLKQQSEIDVNSSQALLNIVKSIESVPNAVIRIGSILVVKLTNELGEVSLQSRTLSIKEMYLLNKNPDLLQNPQKILSAISKALDEGEKN